MKSKLALHTTSGELGISIADGTEKPRSQFWDLGRDLGKYLHQKLAEFIKPTTWQDLQFIAVAKGPGSYTSTRIGIVTAKTLAQQLNIPVYGVSTLEILAWEEAKKSKVEKILVQMKANQGEVFVGAYQIKPDKYLSIISSDKIISNEQWEEELNSYKTKFKDNYQLVVAPDKLGFTAPSLLEIASIRYEQEKLNGVFSTWENLTPFYQ
jgi:tRNA threonylcarbamoyl adenosine modification protein YeaZ